MFYWLIKWNATSVTKYVSSHTKASTPPEKCNYTSEKVILQKIRIQYRTSRSFVDTLKKYLEDAVHTFIESKKKWRKELKNIKNWQYADLHLPPFSPTLRKVSI